MKNRDRYLYVLALVASYGSLFAILRLSARKDTQVADKTEFETLVRQEFEKQNKQEHDRGTFDDMTLGQLVYYAHEYGVNIDHLLSNMSVEQLIGPAGSTGATAPSSATGPTGPTAGESPTSTPTASTGPSGPTAAAESSPTGATSQEAASGGLAAVPGKLSEMAESGLHAAGSLVEKARTHLPGGGNPAEVVHKIEEKAEDAVEGARQLLPGGTSPPPADPPAMVEVPEARITFLEGQETALRAELERTTKENEALRAHVPPSESGLPPDVNPADIYAAYQQQRPDLTDAAFMPPATLYRIADDMKVDLSSVPGITSSPSPPSGGEQPPASAGVAAAEAAGGTDVTVLPQCPFCLKYQPTIDKLATHMNSCADNPVVQARKAGGGSPPVSPPAAPAAPGAPASPPAGGSGGTTMVPDVTKWAYAAGEQRVREMGFNPVRGASTYHPDAPIGTIAIQMPLAGPAPAGSDVVLCESMGPNPASTPADTGKTGLLAWLRST